MVKPNQVDEESVEKLENQFYPVTLLVEGYSQVIAFDDILTVGWNLDFYLNLVNKVHLL